MPELTVSMPAYNAGKYIRQALDSVLRQEGVEFEVLVVDDGSTDDTATVVTAIEDPRLRLLRNHRRMGIGYCHNVVLRASRAPFIAHVDADDFLLPGALRTMAEALRNDERVGQAHCHFLDADEQGRVAREPCRERWTSFRRDRPPTLDYRAELRRQAGVINHLRTYRRAVLEELGGFNEGVCFGVDYDMALRLLDRYTIKLVPEYLYCWRVHRSNTSESLRFKTLRFWAQRYRIKRQLIRAGKVHFLSDAGFDLPWFIRHQMRNAGRRMRARARTALAYGWTALRFRYVAPLSVAAYRTAVAYLSWWPLSWVTFGRRGVQRAPSVAASEHVAYYHHVFPLLSETFIQREVSALRSSGIAVDVVALWAGDKQYLHDDALQLMETTHYLQPVNPQRLAAYRRRFLLRRPFTTLNLFLYLFLRQHSAQKSYRMDRMWFDRVLHLAGVLEEKGVTRVHSPWATMDALVAILAARLLRIPCSVQARASDIHRHVSAVGLRERLVHAEFVITNARYNESVIRSLLPPGEEGKIHTIYEGIDVRRFQPGNGRNGRLTVARLLSVARLTEPKGLEYLVAACKLLRDAGHAVHCEIIGGKQARETNYCITLHKLRQTLGLETDVTFHGAQPFDRVLETYRDVDIFVLPAVEASDGRRDITPNALIEAMAMQLPVVSTHSGAIPEIVEDGVSGLLVPPRDAAALAQAIMRLLSDAALRAQLGKNARKRVEERFDINKNIAGYVALFGGVKSLGVPGALTAQEYATRG